MPPTNIAEMPSNASTFVATLNAVIKKCRDILRLEGITGMDSMKHLTMYTLLRRLDTSECKKLKIPTKFSWEKFMDLKDDHQRSFDLLYCKSGVTEDLISCLDNLFGTKNFNFKLNNPTHHVEILNEFKKLDFSNLDGKIDILGTIYEIHLGSGSNKSAMRDLGQFFTERDVCNYMTALCNPKVLSDGRAESVLDPTMGTGGFLSSYIQHLGNSVDWSKMHNDIAGYDIDEFVMSIGKINLYLQTGVLFDRIKQRDTLKEDIGTVTQRLKFKNILANMPFGVKGLKYVNCCPRVKTLGIDGTKSEPLFLQLMMSSLDNGGRCAVVVPDGVLVNTSKCHNLTRKYLLEHFELKRVIKMKGQFFSNTGIQPSILFFENTGKPSSVTEFWEVEKNSAGVISEILVVSVPREKIDTDSYSLDMRRYVEVAVSEKVSAFPMVKLLDVIDFKNGKNIPERDRTEVNTYPYYASNGIKGYVDKYLFEGSAVLLGEQGSAWHTSLHYVNDNTKFYAGNHTIVMKPKNNNILLKYLYYYLKQQSLDTFNKCAALIPELDKERFYNTTLPLPPLETQQEIVAELDNIYDNAHKASQMATSIKTQMASVMKSVGMRGYERKKLEEILEVFKTGKNKSDTESGEYPFYMANGISQYVKTYQFDGEFILNGRCGSKLDDSCYYVNGKFSASDFTYVMKAKPDLLMNMYLYYYIKYCIDWNEFKTGSTMPNLPRNAVLERLIPIPPLETQQQILTILNELEGERKSLEQMASKAEQRAKFVLDGYLNSA